MAQAMSRQAARMAERARARVVEDLARLMADDGIGVTALARASGISHGYLSEILAGRVMSTFEVYARLAVPLGADLSARLYPNTGPVIRDRHQARILEALLRELHQRWRPFLEASVWKPVRGAIDVVLHDAAAHLVVAAEIESDLRRIEQTVRWSKEKVEALPSWSEWPRVHAPGGETPAASQLLIVRRTRANRTTAAEFAGQLALVYPAHPADALASLGGPARWAGGALVWAVVERDRVHFAPTR